MQEEKQVRTIVESYEVQQGIRCDTWSLASTNADSLSYKVLPLNYDKNGNLSHLIASLLEVHYYAAAELALMTLAYPPIAKGLHFSSELATVETQTALWKILDKFWDTFEVVIQLPLHTYTLSKNI
jgi:hypothetical protein